MKRDSEIMKKRGFTLIEMMVTVAIVGLLAALAVPSYQNYVIRSKMVDAYMLMDANRIKVEEYFEVEGVMPTESSKLGLPTQTPIDEVVSNLKLQGDNSLQSATLYVMLNKGVVDGLSSSDGAFGIRATQHPDGHLTWECKRFALEAKYMPGNCR